MTDPKQEKSAGPAEPAPPENEADRFGKDGAVPCGSLREKLLDNLCRALGEKPPAWPPPHPGDDPAPLPPWQKALLEELSLPDPDGVALADRAIAREYRAFCRSLRPAGGRGDAVVCNPGPFVFWDYPLHLQPKELPPFDLHAALFAQTLLGELPLDHFFLEADHYADEEEVERQRAEGDLPACDAAVRYREVARSPDGAALRGRLLPERSLLFHLGGDVGGARCSWYLKFEAWTFSSGWGVLLSSGNDEMTITHTIQYPLGFFRLDALPWSAARLLGGNEYARFEADWLELPLLDRHFHQRSSCPGPTEPVSDSPRGEAFPLHPGEAELLGLFADYGENYAEGGSPLLRLVHALDDRQLSALARREFSPYGRFTERGGAFVRVATDTSRIRAYLEEALRVASELGVPPESLLDPLARLDGSRTPAAGAGKEGGAPWTA